MNMMNHLEMWAVDINMPFNYRSSQNTFVIGGAPMTCPQEQVAREDFLERVPL